MTGDPRSSASVLHKQWAKLEDQQHELAVAIDAGRARGADLALLRKRQASLLLEINSLVAQIQDAPARTPEDFLALLDVALDHELNLACDIAFYGLADYPLTTRLLRRLAREMPGFKFNSLRRWLRPDQFHQLMGDATLLELAAESTGPAEQTRFGDPEISPADDSREEEPLRGKNLLPDTRC